MNCFEPLPLSNELILSQHPLCTFKWNCHSWTCCFLFAGYRIGKGEGFADLEYAMMKCMGAVDDDTIIITTVHDDQIVDIPAELIGPHDISADYIVTPTQIIECPKQPKPAGIIWAKLTREKLRRIPILRKLRAKERDEGKDVSVKDDIEGPQGDERDQDEDDDRDDEEKEKENKDRPRRRYRNYRRGGGNFRRRDDGDRRRDRDEDGDRKEDDGEHDRDRDRDRDRGERRGRRGEGGERRGEGGERRRGGRRRGGGGRRRSEGKGDRDEKDGDREDGERSGSQERSGDDDRRDKSPRGQARRPPNRRVRINQRPPTVYIGGIPRSLRVSEFKTKVKERGVAPLRVIWHGANRHAFLQFVADQEAEDALNSLKELSIDDKPLKIEMSNRNRKRNRDSQQGEASGEEKSKSSDHEEREEN